MASPVLIDEALRALGHFNAVFADNLVDVQRLLADCPPTLHDAVRGCMTMPLTEVVERDATVDSIPYTSNEDIVQASVAARRCALVQRQRMGNELVALISAITEARFDPNPEFFDGLLFKAHSVPMLRFVNLGSQERSGRTLVFDLGHMQRLFRRTVADCIREASDKEMHKSVFGAMDQHERRMRVTIGAIVVGLTAAVTATLVRSL